MKNLDCYESNDSKRHKIKTNLILCLPITVEECDKIMNGVNIVEKKPKKKMSSREIHKVITSNNTKTKLNFSIEDEKNKLYKSFSTEKSQISKINIKKKAWVHATDKRCWWCTYKFDSTPCAIPMSYNQNNEYTLYGCFCSFNCTKSYILNCNLDKQTEKISLLQQMFFEIYESNEIIIPAPPKEILMDYGGQYTIQEFREMSGNQKIIYRISIPPFNSIEPYIEKRNIYDSIDKFNKKTFCELLNENPEKYKINISNTNAITNKTKSSIKDNNINNNFMNFFLKDKKNVEV